MENQNCKIGRSVVAMCLALFAMTQLTSCNGNKSSADSDSLKLNDKGYLEKRGVNVMVYSNPFSAAFYDEKRSGIDIIHHGVLTITNGGVRFNETPEQWDLVPEMDGKREIDSVSGEIRSKLYYKEYDFRSEIRVAPKDKGFTIQVWLDKPVPDAVAGKACFNLEFLPSAYWNHSYMVDGKPAYFPRYAGYDTEVKPLSEKAKQVNDLITSDLRGRDEFTVVKPLAKGNRFVMAPDEPTRLVTVTSDTEMQLYDGRIVAQNGWFVLHSFLPAGQTGKVLEWYVEPNSVSDWVREPVIGFSQVGYTTKQHKETIIEVDPSDKMLPSAKIFRVSENGEPVLVKAAQTVNWGNYLRYNYLKADFSDITEPGIYYIEYGNQKTNIFPISDNVYSATWYPTLDVWFPEQMDHMQVKEGYRVWHSAPHMDDVLQAPINTPHFDMFEQGTETYSPYKSYDFISGFDKGGWFDAGDFDIEAGSHCNVLLNFVTVWDEFRPERDETMVDQKNHYVNIHFADGKPDLLQQIEHGVYPIVTMVEKIGHACRGINHATLYQYNRLDEPSTITDNKHCTGDERWLFTYSNLNLEFQFCSALAGCARVLKDFNPELSERCLKSALKLWNDNIDKVRRPGMTNQAALQLYLATNDKKYIAGMEEAILNGFKPRQAPAQPEKALSTDAPQTTPSGMPTGLPGGNSNQNMNPQAMRMMQLNNLPFAFRVAPYMSENFVAELKPYVEQYKQMLDTMLTQNPYGVNVYGTGWGSTGSVVGQGINAYWINKYYPEIIGKDYIYRSADFIFGCHPFSNLSFVTGVGVKPKNVSYGNNRADFSFIAGALVPGFLLLQPDYIENKDDWPFFWGQNEATIGGNAQYLLFASMLANLK